MSALVGIGAGLALVVVGIRILENRFIFFPPRYPEGFEGARSSGLPLEEVWITADDGVRLNAWFLPGSGSRKALLCFHGNAENIGYALERMKVLARLKTSVLAVDYRGYGKSEGSPSEAGVYRDADAAYRYLLQTRHFQPEDIFVHGQSLGGAVAIDLASRRDCGGLIVESSFTSGREMARRMFRLPLLEYIPRSRFDSLEKIRRVRAPVLVIHGTRDNVIPFSMGQRLYQAAPDPKSFLPIEGGGHDDGFLTGGNGYLESFRTFLEGALAGGALARP